MPRHRTLSDQEILLSVLSLIHQHGPDAATFAAVSQLIGLSGSTLVQRFGTKAGMLHAALLQAWDMLEAQTLRLANEAEYSIQGVISFLTNLSKDYGDTCETYADGLIILREDLRDPILRKRGKEWGFQLATKIEELLRDYQNCPAHIGQTTVFYWQGAVLWWGFEQDGSIEHYISRRLKEFFSTYPAFSTLN